MYLPELNSAKRLFLAESYTNYMQYFINLNWVFSPTLCTSIKIYPLYKMLLWNVLSRLNINHRDAGDLITALDAILQISDMIFLWLILILIFKFSLADDELL